MSLKTGSKKTQSSPTLYAPIKGYRYRGICAGTIRGRARRPGRGDGGGPSKS